MTTRRAPQIAFAAAILFAGTPATGQVIGPTSSQSPYVLPAASGVQTISLLTVGDSPAGSTYRMVGNPDGLGALANGDGTITLLMNHELFANTGAVRAHGTNGAFVSRWQINTTTYAVEAGRDLITSTVAGTGGAAPFSRFCSADLPAATAFFNAATGLGTTERIFMTGEESGNEGRTYGAVVPTAFTTGGTAYFLPRLGRFNHENAVACPTPQDRTIVIGTDDSAPGQVYVYVGTKQNSGTAVDRAGLTNGSLYGIAVAGVANENRTTGIPSGTRFGMSNFGDVSAMTGAALQTASVTAGVTQFLRPEDGAWDTQDGRRFYFVTTDQFNGGPTVGRSRLWRLTFDNIATPESGGMIEMLLDGTEGHQMLDNITVTREGRVIMNEDPGGNAILARVWQYDPATDSLTGLGVHDPSKFMTGGSNFIGQGEESSGIIDVTALFDPLGIRNQTFLLLTTQAHNALGGELVEGGQLMLMIVPVPEPSSIALTAAAGVGVAIRVWRRGRERPVVS